MILLKRSNLLAEQAIRPILVKTEFHLLNFARAKTVPPALNKADEILHKLRILVLEELKLHRIDGAIHFDIHLELGVILVHDLPLSHLMGPSSLNFRIVIFWCESTRSGLS